MSTVEMEVFSNAQLLVLVILMFLGGEVFTSVLGLLLTNKSPVQRAMTQSRIPSVDFEPDEVEPLNSPPRTCTRTSTTIPKPKAKDLKFNATRYLAYLVMGYLLVIHVGGTISILLYSNTVSNARDILRAKSLNTMTFAVFTTVSSFSNCGFIPTNENMLVFKKNSGLLLLIMPQVLLGNTLFPPCLRLLIWVMNKFTKRQEFEYLVKDSREIGYYHLLPYLHSLLLVATVLGFVVIQVVLICSMEWHSEALGGMSSYQKVISGLFLSVNSRHTGEYTADLSTLASAILVVFVVMMYLPPYTTFLPFKKRSTSRNEIDDKYMGLVKSLIMSQLSYLAIFVILICITERQKLSDDPLNFNVFNIVIEVVSAYGNVGFSTGYSCARQLKPDGNCKDAWYGFVGKWSNKGKLILIFVMLFGRLKKFSMDSGEAWNLS